MYPHMVKRGERGLSGVPLIGALMSFMKPHPHELISSKRSKAPKTVIGELGFNTWILGDTGVRVYSRLCDSLQCKFLLYLLSFAAELPDSGINIHCFHFITSCSLLNFLQSDFTLTGLLKLLFERSNDPNCQIHKSLLIILSSFEALKTRCS